MPVENVKGFENVTCHHTSTVNLYGCYIGEGTKIGSFVEIGDGVRIGKRCKIQSFAFIPPGVTIGNDVFVGPGVCFTNVKHVNPHRKAERFQETFVDDGAVIGANATILPGIRIGEGAIVGAGAVVTKNVMPHFMVVGNPAKVI